MKEPRLTDTVSVRYLGPLQVLHFDSKTGEYLAFDRVKDRIVGFDSDGNVATKKQLSREGAEGYGAVLEGFSVLQSGNIFLVSSNYEFLYDQNWNLIHRKPRSVRGFNPLNLFKISLYPSFKDTEDNDRVLSKVEYPSVRALTKTYFDTAKVLLEYTFSDYSKSELIEFSGLDHNNGAYFKSDYSKPLFKIDEFKNQLLLSFEYSNSIFRYSLSEGCVRIDDMILSGEVFEDKRRGVEYSLNGSERMRTVRENMLHNDRIIDFWPVGDYMIVKGQKSRDASLLPSLSLKSSESIENYTQKMSKLLARATYQLYESGILKKERLDLHGDILFVSGTRIYVQKYANEEVEEDDIVIFIYDID